MGDLGSVPSSSGASAGTSPPPSLTAGGALLIGVEAEVSASSLLVAFTMELIATAATTRTTAARATKAIRRVLERGVIGDPFGHAAEMKGMLRWSARVMTHSRCQNSWSWKAAPFSIPWVQ